MTAAEIQLNELALFEESWARAEAEAEGKPGAPDHSEPCPPPWVVSRLLELAAEETGRPIRELAPAIRCILEESRFVGHAYEVQDDATTPPSTGPQVQRVIRTLEQVRAHSSVARPSSRRPHGPAEFVI